MVTADAGSFKGSFVLLFQYQQFNKLIQNLDKTNQDASNHVSNLLVTLPPPPLHNNNSLSSKKERLTSNLPPPLHLDKNTGS